MNDLLPQNQSSLPWSKLLDAGWVIAHMHHGSLSGRRFLIAMFRKGNDVILEQGEDDLTVFKKLEVRACLSKRSEVPKASKEAPDPRHRAFMDLWTKRHTEFFRRPYVFNGAADGAQLKRFLKAMPDTSASAIMDVAERAWEEQERNAFCKESKRSTTIMGFLTGWNGINAELDRLNPKTSHDTSHVL